MRNLRFDFRMTDSDVDILERFKERLGGSPVEDQKGLIGLVHLHEKTCEIGRPFLTLLLHGEERLIDGMELRPEKFPGRSFLQLHGRTESPQCLFRVADGDIVFPLLGVTERLPCPVTCLAKLTRRLLVRRDDPLNRLHALSLGN